MGKMWLAVLRLVRKERRIVSGYKCLPCLEKSIRAAQASLCSEYMSFQRFTSSIFQSKSSL